MPELSLLDIPIEIWQCCIFEYWIGPIHEIKIKTHHDIMKFKKTIQPRMACGLDLSNVRTVQKFCCAVSKRFKRVFVEGSNEFWLQVSNFLELVVYWKRYESSEGLSLAKGDLFVAESIPLVRMQKLIEATEMNYNREYVDIIDPSECRSNGILPDLTIIENEFETDEVNIQFEKRIQTLMMTQSKYEKIMESTQLNIFDLFMHKALMISLDMISYFDSESFSPNYNYDPLEACCLIARGLFDKEMVNTKALGLLIDLNDIQEPTIFNNIALNFIALSINMNEWVYQVASIPNHIQYLCLRIGAVSDCFEGALFYSKFLEEGEFPNVRDLTIRFEENCYSVIQGIDQIEKNILAGITKKKFPKLLRISLQGFSYLDSFSEFDFFREIPYVEIILRSWDPNYNQTYNWEERKVRDLVTKHFVESDSLIHHLIMHANILRNGDAKFDSIKEYYDLSLGRFVSSISHSSFNEYYNRCYE